MLKNPFKRKSKNKEQLAHEMKLKSEADRQKRIAKDILYPILHQHATSIQHAQRSCEIMKTVIMQAMQMPFKEKNVDYLNLKEELTKEKDVPDLAMYQAFVDGFKYVSITDALKLLEGMGGSIDGWVRGQSARQNFKTIKIEELIN